MIIVIPVIGALIGFLSGGDAGDAGYFMLGTVTTATAISVELRRKRRG